MPSISNICSAFFIPLASSSSSFVWRIINFLWSWYGIWIFLVLSVWIIIELFTRNGKFHYNSENGFSPPFNIFVGSGLYWGIQSILLILLKKIFGESVYCFIWPYPLHAVIFILTGLLLNKIGFWVYLKVPGIGKLYK